MQGVNVVGAALGAVHGSGRRLRTGTRRPRFRALLFRQSNGNPVTGRDTSMAGSQGTQNKFYRGFLRSGSGFRCCRALGRSSFLRRSRSIRCIRGNMRWGRIRRIRWSRREPILRSRRAVLGSYSRSWWISTRLVRRAAATRLADGTEAAPVAAMSQGLVDGAAVRVWSFGVVFAER